MKKNIHLVLLILSLFLTNAFASSLPSGFVYLSEMDPSILINLKYHGYENFTGKPIKGCRRNHAVITEEAAKSLSNVQEDLVMQGYSLVVYDAYHPEKSNEVFKNWLKTKNVQKIKNSYHPNLDKDQIEKKGYIKAKYEHIRGSTVDVTLIPLKDKLRSSCTHKKRSYKNQKDIIYLDDGSLDMGTSYDLFDPLSSFDNKNIPNIARNNRLLLRNTMKNHGFIPNDKFWWQFTLVREPYIDSKFDFDV